MTRGDHQLPSQLLTEVSSLQQILGSLLLSDSHVSVDSRQFGSSVSWSWGHKQKHFNQLELVIFGNFHQVVDKLVIIEQTFRVMGISQKKFNNILVA